MLINRGVSLGLNFPFIELISGVFLMALVFFWFKEKKAWGFLLMVIGGALNFRERLLYGGVFDYWRIPFTRIYNNTNDYIIVLGVVQLIWYLLWKKRQK